MLGLRTFVLVISIICLRHLTINGQNLPELVRYFGDETRIYPDPLIAAVVLFCVVGKLMAVLSALHAEIAGPQLAWRRFALWRSVIEWSWVPVHAIAILSSPFSTWLMTLEQDVLPQACVVCLWFVPSLIVLGTLEYCTVELEIDMANAKRARFPSQAQSMRGNSSLSSVTSESIRKNMDRPNRLWLSRVRLGPIGQILTCAIPVGFLLAFKDVLGYLVPTMPVDGQVSLALLGLVLLSITCAPLWMQWTTGARAIGQDHPWQLRLNEYCKQMRLASPKLMLVGMQGNWQGAAIVGWTPVFRQLWLSPCLLQNLSEEQVDMIVLHELAHLKRGHAWLRLAPLAAIFVGLLAWLNQSPVVSLSSEVNLQAWPIVLLCATTAWLLGWICRRCELDADQCACQHATRLCPWTDGRPGRARATLAAALEKLHAPGHPRDQTTWLHPSLLQRLNYLAAGS